VSCASANSIQTRPGQKGVSVGTLEHGRSRGIRRPVFGATLVFGEFLLPPDLGSGATVFNSPMERMDFSAWIERVRALKKELMAKHREILPHQAIIHLCFCCQRQLYPNQTTRDKERKNPVLAYYYIGDRYYQLLQRTRCCFSCAQTFPNFYRGANRVPFRK
jgi:hypothetical protein